MAFPSDSLDQDRNTKSKGNLLSWDSIEAPCFCVQQNDSNDDKENIAPLTNVIQTENVQNQTKKAKKKFSLFKADQFSLPQKKIIVKKQKNVLGELGLKKINDDDQFKQISPIPVNEHSTKFDEQEINPAFTIEAFNQMRAKPK